MLKHSSSRVKEGIAVSLAVLFAVSLTAVAASAHHGGGRGGWGWGWGGGCCLSWGGCSVLC